MDKLGLIGLGKMGFNLIQNIKKNGYNIIGFDINQEIYKKLKEINIDTAKNLDELLVKLETPRTILLLLPSGKITNRTILELINKLDKNDTIIDAGNSFYKDSIINYQKAKGKGINFIDCGTSGGPNGALNGPCLMVGSEKEVMDKYFSFFKNIACHDGFLYTGVPGSGHYAKMVHNGIEYGMMQAIAEGYQLLKNSKFSYDLKKLSKLWNNGSVIRSYLIELMENIMNKDQDLKNSDGLVEMSGEGLWCLNEALEQNIATPILGLSIMMRQKSSEKESYANKVVANLRNSFGGHSLTKK